MSRILLALGLFAAILYLKFASDFGLKIIGIYGLIAVGRLVFQIVTAAMARQRHYQRIDNYTPLASVIMTVFNEDIPTLWKCLESLDHQTYPVEVIVVDDGSKDHKLVKRIVDRFGFTYVYQKNKGKREAMYNGFKHMSPEAEVVLTCDSDTVWDKNAARELVNALLSNPKIGAATGFVDTLNPNDTWLTKLVAMRYYMAFQYERASQSYFGAVNCVSGPLGAYRRDIIDTIKHKFVNQTFRGQKCTYGDDRHLTNLVLGLGFQVVYSKAVCYTEAPRGIRQFIKQQARWGRSHWRELIWQAKALPLQHAYLTYDFVISLILPFMLLLTLGHYAYLMTHDMRYGWVLLETMLGMNLLRSIPAMVETRKLSYLLFVFYGVMHMVILLPLKMVSLVSINKGSWGTR